MRSAVGVLQLLSILTAYVFQVIKCDLIDFPRNTVAVVNTNVTIACKTNPIDSSVSWMFNSVSKQPGPDIYSYGNVNSIYQMKNMSVAKFDLTFASVRLDDAGVYTCQQVGNNNARAAWLNVVVNDPPLCWVADARNNSNIWNVTLGCSVEYNGTSSERNLLVPMANWSDCQPWLQSYTDIISQPNSNDAYYRNFTSLASLIFNASTKTNCAFSLWFKTYTTDSQQDNRDPLFVSQRVPVNASLWQRSTNQPTSSSIRPTSTPPISSSASNNLPTSSNPASVASAASAGSTVSSNPASVASAASSVTATVPNSTSTVSTSSSQASTVNLSTSSNNTTTSSSTALSTTIIVVIVIASIVGAVVIVITVVLVLRSTASSAVTATASGAIAARTTANAPVVGAFRQPDRLPRTYAYSSGAFPYPIARSPMGGFTPQKMPSRFAELEYNNAYRNRVMMTSNQPTVQFSRPNNLPNLRPTTFTESNSAGFMANRLR